MRDKIRSWKLRDLFVILLCVISICVAMGVCAYASFYFFYPTQTWWSGGMSDYVNTYCSADVGRSWGQSNGDIVYLTGSYISTSGNANKCAWAESDRAGTAYLYAYRTDTWAGITCTITVADEGLVCTDASGNKKNTHYNITLNSGGSVKVGTYLGVGSATRSWSSDNTSLVTVGGYSSSGSDVNKWATITANSNGVAGTTIVRATCNAYTSKTGRTESWIVYFHVTVNPVRVTSVSGLSSHTIWTGSGVQLSASVAPSNATYKTVSWSSNNNSVATVNSNGYVTGVGPGSCTITASADGKSTSCTITVLRQTDSVSASTAWGGVWVGGTTQAYATVSPSNTTYPGVTWSTSNSGYASINSSGVITGVSTGGAQYRDITVYATSTDGWGRVGSTGLRVYQPITSLSISGNNYTYVGSGTQLTANISPSYSYYRYVTWSSSNSNVASVNSNGYVTGVSPGGCYIYATAPESWQGQTSIYMTVYNPITSVNLNDTYMDLFTNGTSKNLTATLPSTTGVTDTRIYWYSNNTGLATVSCGNWGLANNGGAITVYPNSTSSVGSTTIVACPVANTNVTNSCTVVLYNFWLSASNISLYSGGTYNLTAMYSYAGNSGTSYGSVNWSTSNANVASISTTSGATVTITGKNAGTATITAVGYASDNSATRTCSVTVKSFSVSATSTSLYAHRSGTTNGQTATLSAAYNGSALSVNWSIVSGSSYVSLSTTSGSSTVVTAKACNGSSKSVTATIRATTTDGNGNAYKDTVITIKQPVNSISLNDSALVLFTNTSYAVTATVSPTYAYSSNVNWTTGNSSVASLSATSGAKISVTGSGAGTTTITANAADGRGATTSASVEVRKLSLNTTNVTLYLNSQFTLNSYYTLSTDANKKAQSVTWKTSDSSVASISTTSGSSTVVTGKAAGSATITATAAADTSASVTCAVTVKSIDITFSQNVIYVKTDATAASKYQAQAYAKVDDTDIAVTWTSSDTSLATVNTKGVVTGVSTGSAKSATVTITATVAASTTTSSSANPGGSASKTIEVRQQVTGATITNSSGTKQSNIIMYIGTTLSLKANATPTYAYNTKLNWSTSNSNVVSLSATSAASGGSVTLTGKSVGSATITVKANDGVITSALATCNVTVKDFELNYTSAIVYVGKTVTLNSGQSVKWSVSDSSIATLSATSGSSIVVTGKKQGTATVTATSTDGSTNISKTCTITVKTISVKADKSVIYVKHSVASSTAAYTATVKSYINGTQTTCTWKTSNSKVGTISSSKASSVFVVGQDSGVKEATVTITATSTDGTETQGSASTTITVRQQVTGITLSGSDWCYVEEQATLTPTITPTYAYDKTVSWSSSNTDVATVDANGVVTGVSYGTVTITATAKDGQGAKGTMSFTVYNKVNAVEISKSTITLFTKGSNYSAVSAYTKPTVGTRDSNVYWRSDNTNLVTISGGQNLQAASNGKITLIPNASGTLGITTITATSKDNPDVSKKSTVELVGFALSKSSINMYLNGTYELTALKTSASNILGSAYSNVKWSITSGSDKISLTSTSGATTTIKANAVGTATIKATATADNSISASCTVIVKEFLLSATKTTIFAPRKGINNPETTTLTTMCDAPLNVNWSIVSGSDYASLSVTSNASSTVLTPKVLSVKTATVTVRATTIDFDANISKDIVITIRQPINTITFGKTTITMFTNTTYTFNSTTISPTDPYNARLGWNSPTNLTITAVDTNEHSVTIKSNASPVNGAKLIATANDGRGATATATVNVRKLSLNTTNLTMYLNSTFTLKAFYTLSTDANKQAQSVAWSTSNANVVSISAASGSSTVLTGKSAGTATITAKATADTSASLTCNVTVKELVLTIDDSFIYVKEDNTASGHYTTQAYAKVDGVDASVTWKSSNTNLATVDSTGLITGISTNGAKSASVTITATIASSGTANSGGSASKTIEIRQQVTGATICDSNSTARSSLVIYEGTTYQLKAVATPSYAYNSKLNWSTSDSSIVALSKTTSSSSELITLTGKNAGVATLKVTSNDGIVTNVLATCTVTVKGFAISATKTSIFAPRTGVNNPETTTLTAKYIGTSTSELLNIDWAIISGSEYATLSKTANASTTVLTPKEITVTSVNVVVQGTTIDGDSSTSKTLTITIKKPVSTIAFNKDVITMFTNTTYTFSSPTMTPDNPYNPVWNWNSPTNLTITKTDTNGHVVAVKSNGNTVNGASLTATAADGRGATDTITVNVRKLSLNTSHVNLYLGSTFTLQAYYTVTTDANKHAQSVAWSITSGSDIIKLSMTKGSATTISTTGKTGTATIKATATEDTSTSLTCTVTVKSIDLTIDDSFIYVKESNTKSTDYTTQAHASVVDETPVFTWKSSDTSIATIDSATGAITGISTNDQKEVTVAFTATIAPQTTTATSANPGGSKTITLKVRQQVTGATIYDSNNTKRASIVVYAGTSYQLKAVASPSYAYNTKLNWSTSNSSVAALSKTTSNSGELITIVGGNAGTATLKVTSNDGLVSKTLATCNVTVKKLSLHYDHVVVYVDETLTLNAYSTISTETLQSVTWSISDSSYASIGNTTGSSITITGHKIGNVVLTATSTDGDSNTYVTCNIEVKDIRVETDKEVIYVKHDIAKDVSAYTANVTAYINGVETPATWTTSNSNVGLINVGPTDKASTITVTGIHSGVSSATVKITGTSTDATESNGSDYVIIEVRQQAYEIIPNQDNIIMYEGTSFKTFATSMPEYAYDRSMNWEVVEGEEFVEIATNMPVANTGMVTIRAKSAGNAKIKVSANDGQGAHAIINVVVKELSFNPSTITMFKNYTYDLKALVNGNASTTVTWNVDDPSIVSIESEKGTSTMLHALEVGTTQVYATTFDGDTNKTIAATVKVMGMVVESPEKTLYVGETISLTAKIDGVVSAVKWTTSDSSIATVSTGTVSTATVTGVSNGEVEITATSVGYTVNGSITTKIKVLQQVEKLDITSKDDIVIYVGGSYPVTISPTPADTDTLNYIWKTDGYDYLAKFEKTDNPLTANLVGRRVGSTEFTITADDKYEASVSGHVTIKELVVPKEIVIYAGDTYTLTACDNNNVEQNVKWSLDGDAISIDKTSGSTIVITSNKKGEATLSATTTDADGNATFNIPVRVVDIYVELDSNILYVGDKIEVTSKVNGVASACTWTSNNPDIVSVTTNGTAATITGVAKGSTTIVITSQDGGKQEIELEVRQEVESITLNKSEIMIYGREAYTGLIATMNPEDASDFGLNIATSASNVVDVSIRTSGNIAYLTIKPIASGNTTVTLSAKDDRGATASFNVSIRNLELSHDELFLTIGDSELVSAFGIENLESAIVDWTIEDADIAKVTNQNGGYTNVIGLTAGQTTLTATATNGDINASTSITVHVSRPAGDFTLDNTKLTMYLDSTAQLNLLSDGGNYGHVTWTTDNDNVAITDSNNSLASLRADNLGTTVVTASASTEALRSANWYTGFINFDTGEFMYYNEEYPNSVYSDPMLLSAGTTYSVQGGNSAIRWRIFDLDGNYVGSMSSTNYYTPDQDCYVRIMFHEGCTEEQKNMCIVSGAMSKKMLTASKWNTGFVNLETGELMDYNPEYPNTVYTDPIYLNAGTTYTMYGATPNECRWRVFDLDGKYLGSMAMDSASYTPDQDCYVRMLFHQGLEENQMADFALVYDDAWTENNAITATCTVDVIRADEDGYSLNQNEISLWVGETCKLVSMYELEACEADWTIADNSIASISATNGSEITVTGLKAGTTTITVMPSRNTVLKCKVVVKQPVEQIVMNASVTVSVGGVATLKPVCLPSNASNTGIVWSGYDESIIKVTGSNTATITGLARGETTLTATAADGFGATASCKVIVVQKVLNISIPSAYSLYVGNSVRLTATITPSNANNLKVVWSSKNATIASVNASTGLVKGLAPGQTVITCTATDGSGISASCNLTVLKFVEEIVLKNSKMDMYTNATGQVNTAKIEVLEILPENIGDVSLKWESSNPEFITVDENGVVTVQVSELPSNLTYTTVTITCSALDGSGTFTTCEITLKQHTVDIELIDYEKFFLFENGIITGLTDYAYEKLEKQNVSVAIPDMLNAEKVLEIADEVFADCLNLTSVTIPATVNVIGENAFKNCTNLANIYVMKNRDEIEDVPWGATNAIVHWLDVTVDESEAVDFIVSDNNRDMVGFKGTSNESLVIPAFFYGDDGTYYKVVGIGNYSFDKRTKLQSVVIPETVTYIGDYAFYGCTNLKEVSIPDCVTEIGDYAFHGDTKLASIEMPAMLKTVGNYAFGNVTSLTEITFYENIKTIGANAFAGANNLRTITINKYLDEVLNAPWGATNAEVVWLSSNN